MASNLMALGVADLLSLMEKQEISAREYAVELSEKLLSENHLNAVQSFSKDFLLQEADLADQKRQSNSGGSLCGIPFIAKDNINSKNFPTTAGTKALLENTTSTNATTIDKLLNEDAILGAKANMHELAFGITSNNFVTGPVRNPKNTEKFAGGSSGGTAAAVAAEIFPIGLGTDTGGSCRIPAALCGAVGFRPSTGRYPIEGVVPISHTRDTVGIISRSVKDVVLFDNILSREGYSLEDTSLNQITLGIPKEVFFENLEPQVENIITAQLSNLEKLGVKLKEISMSDIWSHNEAFGFPVALYEVMQDLPEYLKKYTSGVNIDELVAGIGSPDVAGVFASQMGSEAMPKAAYEAAIGIHGPAMKLIYKAAFSENSLDAIIFPTTPVTARNIGDDETIDLNGVRVPTFLTYIRNTDLGSNVGAPGISLPCKGVSDLPVGIEFDGLPGQDQDLLSLVKSIEMALTS
jgi:mandelamide amidase